MSCTIIAVPYALMWVVGTMAAGTVGTVVSTTQKNKDNIDCSTAYAENEVSSKISSMFNNRDYNTINNKNCTEDVVLTEKHFIEKSFETPFTDKDILMKTLKEHGVKNIAEWENGIAGDIDNYKLIFEKTENDKPYNLRISCPEQKNVSEKIEDFNSEYALNVQEDAYLHILEKIKDTNMQIETEEVMDDNTIVLTINVD